MNFFGLSLTTILARLIFLFTIMPIHEYAHGWMASKMGDNTAKYSGRLDLNPFTHLDPMGSVLILLTGFGWAKPVPINPNNFYDRKKGTFLTSLAGPMANILLGLFMLIVAKLFYRFGIGGILPMVAITIMQVSIHLAVFNLFPIPPLDGWNMLSVFLPYDKYYKVIQYQREISLVFILLIFLGVLSYPIVIVSNFIITLLQAITFFI